MALKDGFQADSGMDTRTEGSLFPKFKRWSGRSVHLIGTKIIYGVPMHLIAFNGGLLCDEHDMCVSGLSQGNQKHLLAPKFFDEES